MTTYIVPPSQVTATIEGSSFNNGDTIIVRAAGSDNTIALGPNYRFYKYFTMLCDQDPVLHPDPFGYGVLGLTPKTWRARATSPVTITGMATCYAVGSMSVGTFDFRNMNWKLPDFPDWPNLGQTWQSMGYPANIQVLYIRPGQELGSNMKTWLTDMHFEGPMEFSPSVNDPWGDSPLNYYLYSAAANGNDPTYNGMAREDGTNTSPFTSGPLPAGRGPWPGVSTTLRNRRFVPQFNTNLLYNALANMPGAVGATFATELIMRHCSFRNLGGSYSVDPRQDGYYSCIAEKCWHENIYGDWIHASAQARGNVESLTEQYTYREWGTVMTGQGNCSGLDLGNPHVDYRQFYGSTGLFLPRIMIRNTVNDAGAQTGKPNRSGAQDIFDGGPAICHQIKVHRHLNISARDKAYGQSTQSPHIEGLQGLVIPQAPLPITVNSAGVYPTGSNNTLIMNTNVNSIISKGLIKDTNVASFNFPNVSGTTTSISPRLVNTKLIVGTSNPSNPINIPTTIAPNGNVVTRCLAESYTNNRQPNWPADIVDFLNSGEDFSWLSVVGTPATTENCPINGPITSAKERVHIGDFNSTAPIHMITPGLQWAEWDYVGTTQTQAFSANDGTITDGHHIQLYVPGGIPTAATGKDFYYSINGQTLKYTAVTQGAWQYPACTKPETGQWSKTAVGAVIPGATADQLSKGIVYLRFSVTQPSAVLSSAQFFSGSTARGMRIEITTTTTGTYSINFAFGNSSGGQQGLLGTGTGILQYGVVYEAFFIADFTIATNNSGLYVRRESDGFAVIPWKTATNPQSSSIAWDYSQVAGTTNGNGLRLGNAVPMTLKCAGIWAGQTLSQDDGSGTGTMMLYDPGSFPPERMGINGMGLNGTKPYLFLLGETTPNNRGTGGSSSWGCTATLTDVGGYLWANPPGSGPKLSFGWDNLPSTINEGDTITATLKTFGSNEPCTATLTIPSGMALVGGGNTVTFAENEVAKTISFTMTQRGNKLISVQNNVGYNNPDNLSLVVGLNIPFTVNPATGYSGDPYPTSIRFLPPANYNPPLSVIGSTTTTATNGVAYSATLTVGGGTPPYTFTVDTTKLPPWASSSTSTTAITISGTPS